MWYFTWILGVLLACAFGIINVLWLEAQEGLDQDTLVLDPLTKLPTRVEFLESLEESIEQYKNDQLSFSLILVSIDAVKEFARLGHSQKADQTIQKVAEIIKQETRRPIDMVARYDAETFAILLPSATTSTAEAIAQRICEQSIEQTGLQSSDSVLSIGVAEYPVHLTCSTDENIQNKIRALLQSTDKAMVNAQQQGNNRICCAENGTSMP